MRSAEASQLSGARVLRRGERSRFGHGSFNIYKTQVDRTLGQGARSLDPGKPPRSKRSRTMKEGAAYQASGAGQQIVESSGSSSVAPFIETEKPKTKKGGGSAPGLSFPRFFTEAGVDPFDEIEWDLRSAVIGSEKGEVVFEQHDVEIPRSWSQQATNIVVSKYFRGQIGMPERERSVKQLIGRVVDTITEWGRNNKYFATDEDLQAFSDDLKHILVYQKAAFNSPVWFNCGFEKAPQCSACFINSVQDTMDSILTLARTEGMLFKFGSGTGTNLSPIRSSRELLAGGGT